MLTNFLVPDLYSPRIPITAQIVHAAEEVNAESIVVATLSRLAREGKFDQERAQQAFVELGVETETTDPAYL